MTTKSKQLENRRFEAIDLIIKKKQSQTDVARKLGVSVMAVQYWIHTYRNAGKKGLQSVPRPGRPARLTQRQKKQLAQILLKGSLKAGFSTISGHHLASPTSFKNDGGSLTTWAMS